MILIRLCIACTLMRQGFKPRGARGSEVRGGGALAVMLVGEGLADASKVTASAVRLVRKRKVLVLNGQFRPKRPENGLY